MRANPFADLWVLEIANNHWGSVERGTSIIRQHAAVARRANIRAALKLQIRDVEGFIHPAHINDEERYIRKTLATRMDAGQYLALVKAVRAVRCIPMATPFDEASVDLCHDLDIPLLKIASSDVNDWPLIERIAHWRKPVSISTGGSSVKDTDDVVEYFEHRDIPICINHCVSIYPSFPHDMDLNQLDWLRERYPEHVIGLSTHEGYPPSLSIMVAVAKGARTFERHVDIPNLQHGVAAYCSLPDGMAIAYAAWTRARVICGAPGSDKRIIPRNEAEYLDNLVRGVFAARDLEPGPLSPDDLFLAIPRTPGQLSCRDLMGGERLAKAVASGDAIMEADVEP